MEEYNLLEIYDTEAQEKHEQWILEQLKEREKIAASPDAKWYSHEEFWSKVKDN